MEFLDNLSGVRYFVIFYILGVPIFLLCWHERTKWVGRLLIVSTLVIFFVLLCDMYKDKLNDLCHRVGNDPAALF